MPFCSLACASVGCPWSKLAFSLSPLLHHLLMWYPLRYQFHRLSSDVQRLSPELHCRILLTNVPSSQTLPLVYLHFILKS